MSPACFFLPVALLSCHRGPSMKHAHPFNVVFVGIFVVVFFMS